MMNLNFNELNFIKQSVDSITIKGSDAIFVASVYSKLNKELEKESKKLAAQQALIKQQQTK